MKTCLLRGEMPNSTITRVRWFVVSDVFLSQALPSPNSIPGPVEARILLETENICLPVKQCLAWPYVSPRPQLSSFNVQRPG